MKEYVATVPAREYEIGWNVEKYSNIDCGSWTGGRSISDLKVSAEVGFTGKMKEHKLGVRISDRRGL